MGPKERQAREVRARLMKAGLRASRPRVELGKLLFCGPNRHVSADSLFVEARRVPFPPSLATIYNTLKQFTEAGLLREIPLEGQRSFFDTRIDPHHHYLDVATGELFDAPDDAVEIALRAEAPEGFVFGEVQVVIRVRRARMEP